MKILLVEPGKVPRPAEIDPSLKSMQRTVGGCIQAVYPFEKPVALICNEEEKLCGLSLNRTLRMSDTGEIYDIIAGTFFLCAAPVDSENFASLSAEQIERYSALFQSPEFFLGGVD